MPRSDPNTDGGYAWVILVAAFAVMFIIGMLVYSVGVINTAILEDIDSDISRTSWVGSTVFGMFTLMGPVNGLLTKKLGYRMTCIGGGVLVLIGLLVASFMESVLGLILTYGVITGLGMGLGLNAANVVPGHYFNKRRPFAYGLTVSGSGLGMFAGGPLCRLLLNEYGLSGTFLILGAVGSHLCVAGVIMRPRPRKRPTVDLEKDSNVELDLKIDVSGEKGNSVSKESDYAEPLLTKSPETNRSDLEKPMEIVHSAEIVDDDEVQTESKKVVLETNRKDSWQHLNSVNKSKHISKHFCFISKKCQGCIKVVQNGAILKNYSFLLFLGSCLLWSMGEGAYMFHLPNYAQSKGSTQTQAASLFTVMGLGSLMSRLLAGFAAGDPAIGNLILHIGLVGMAGALALLLPLFSHTYPLQMAFAAAYGLYSGGPNSVLNPLTIELVGLKNIAVASGTESFFFGIGFFIGPPIAGVLYSITNVYDYTFIFAGASLVGAAILGATMGIFGTPSSETLRPDRSREVIIRVEQEV